MPPVRTQAGARGAAAAPGKTRNAIFTCGEITCRKFGKEYYCEKDAAGHLAGFHGGEKARCYSCKKVFTDASNMRKHYFSVHTDVKWGCPYCSENGVTYQVTRKDNLKGRHMPQCQYRGGRDLPPLRISEEEQFWQALEEDLPLELPEVDLSPPVPADDLAHAHVPDVAAPPVQLDMGELAGMWFHMPGTINPCALTSTS